MSPDTIALLNYEFFGNTAANYLIAGVLRNL